MFKAQPAGTRIEGDGGSIVTLHRSTNSAVLALGGPSRPTRSWVIGTRNAGGAYQVHVWLAPTEPGGGQGLLFRSDPPEMNDADYEDFMLEAIQMVEGHGFDMQIVDLSAANAETIRQYLPELPLSSRIWVPPPPVSGPPLETSEQSGMFLAVGARRGSFPTGMQTAAVEISQEVSLPGSEAVAAIGRILSCF
jgi:hypothetical protein